MDTKHLLIENTDFLVKIHYEDRKNSRVSIRRNIINIRLPRLISKKEQNNQIEKLIDWAIQSIMKHPDKFKPSCSKKYTDGDEIHTTRKTYHLRLIVEDNKNSYARLKDDNIFISLSSNLSDEEKNQHVSTLISRCIASEQLPQLKERIHELNNRYFNQDIKEIYLKHNISNWGSCSKSGNINISTRLLFAPDDVLEYVCIHELVHLIEPNHSQRFWQLVSEVMANYKEKNQWLTDNGETCKF